MDRPFDRKTFALLAVLLLGLVSCGKSSTERSSANCSLGLYESCKAQVDKGYIELDSAQLEGGEEYLLFVLAQSPGDDPLSPNSKIQITSDFRSSGPSREEIELRGRLLQKRFRPRNDPGVSLNVGGSYSLGETPESPISTHEQHEFYVLDLQEYGVFDGGKTTPFHVRLSTDPKLRGKKIDFRKVESSPSQYELFLDSSIVKSEADFFETTDCLDEGIPNLFSKIGRPLDLDGKPSINILAASIQSTSGVALGFFNFLNRFSYFGGEPIQDNSFGENVYISPHIIGEYFCSTVEHELQHMINFDYKVMRQIPSDRRPDLESMGGLRREHLGLDEGYAHVVEMLSNRDQSVHRHMLKFLKNPSQTSFSLEASWSSLDVNLRSRGLATLAILHAIALKGGALEWEDPSTQKILADLIQSPHTGFENIANQVEMASSLDFLESFFRAISVSLYDDSEAKKLFPQRITTPDINKGVEFLSRETLIESMDFQDEAAFHPLYAEIPLMGSAQSTQLQPEGIAIYRLIVPEGEYENKITLSSQERPFAAFLTRVR